MRKQKKIRKVFLTLIVAAIAILFMLPLLWMISSSLKNPIQVFENPFRWIADKINWKNYETVWNNPRLPFWKMMINSLTIAVVGVIGQLLVGSLAAYSFAKINFKGKNIVFMIMLATMMIPAQALIIPRYMIFYKMGLYDTLWSIILPNFFNITTIFLLRQFYMGLPDDLVEAARLDGAGHFQIWLKVMLPLTKNGLISAAILAFINAWNEYLNPLIFLPSSTNYTVTLGVRWYMEDTAREYNLMMCSAACAILPIIILYLTAQKYFEDGVAASGLKG